ncbi:MAG TPA: glycosyltransferase 87 family protein, partial [Polyangiaceae bacterium]
AVAEHRRVLETTATPFLYTVFGAVSNDDYDLCLNRFRAILLGAFVLSVVGLARLARHSTTNAFLMVALLTDWFEPLASDLRVGNVGSLQLLQVVVFALLRLHLAERRRDWASGLWLGLSLAFKPNLAPLVLFVWLWQLLTRDWTAWFKTVAGVVGGVGGAVVTSTIAIGSTHPWLEWVSALASIPDANITTMLGNFSPTEVLRPYCGPMTGILLSAPGLALLAYGLAIRLRARQRRAVDSASSLARCDLIWVLAIGCLLPIMAVRLAWLHYFVLATPALLLALTRLQHAPLVELAQPSQSMTSRADRLQRPLLVLAAVGAWLGLAINPLAWIGHSYTMQSYGVMVILATAALLVTLCASTGESR